MIEQRMGFMIQRQIIPCTKCHSTGEIIGENDQCHHCFGKKIEKEKKRITIQIKFLGCSDVLRLKKNNGFIRKHNNLLMVKKLH